MYVREQPCTFAGVDGAIRVSGAIRTEQAARKYEGNSRGVGAPSTGLEAVVWHDVRKNLGSGRPGRRTG